MKRLGNLLRITQELLEPEWNLSWSKSRAWVLNASRCRVNIMEQRHYYLHTCKEKHCRPRIPRHLPLRAIEIYFLTPRSAPTSKAYIISGLLFFSPVKHIIINLVPMMKMPYLFPEPAEKVGCNIPLLPMMGHFSPALSNQSIKLHLRFSDTNSYKSKCTFSLLSSWG